MINATVCAVRVVLICYTFFMKKLLPVFYAIAIPLVIVGGCAFVAVCVLMFVNMPG